MSGAPATRLRVGVGRGARGDGCHGRLDGVDRWRRRSVHLHIEGRSLRGHLGFRCRHGRLVGRHRVRGDDFAHRRGRGARRERQRLLLHAPPTPRQPEVLDLVPDHRLRDAEHLRDRPHAGAVGVQLAEPLLLGADHLAGRATSRPRHDAGQPTFREALTHVANPAVARVTELPDGVGLQPVANPQQRGDGHVATDRVTLPERRDGQAATEQHHVPPHEPPLGRSVRRCRPTARRRCLPAMQPNRRTGGTGRVKPHRTLGGDDGARFRGASRDGLKRAGVGISEAALTAARVSAETAIYVVGNWDALAETEQARRGSTRAAARTRRGSDVRRRPGRHPAARAGVPGSSFPL